jgi:hypothetical protein
LQDWHHHKIEQIFRIAVCDPDKSLTKEHVPAFVHCEITWEHHTQIQIEPNFITAGTLSPEANCMVDGGRVLGHHVEPSPFTVVVHCLVCCGIVTRLAQHSYKAKAREVRPKYSEFSMIKAHDAGVREYGILRVVQCSLSKVRPVWCNGFSELLLCDFS